MSRSIKGVSKCGAPRLIALSKGLARISTLKPLLDDSEVVFGSQQVASDSDSVLAWGLRPSAAKAKAYANFHGLKLCHVEDGLLRSVGLGGSEPPLSLMMDREGLYLDAAVPTELETCIQLPLSAEETARARALIHAWRDARVSKYNYQREYALSKSPPYVLVIDQTSGDASITAGQASAASFDDMLVAALSENPDCRVIVKVHPEVVSGRKKGHFDLDRLGAIPRVTVISGDVHPVSLLESAHAVYAVTSQVGFEALMWGKEVRLFGMPFYGGWGLTKDALPGLDRRKPVAIENLVHGALIEYPRYVDPESMQRSTPEIVVGWLALQRQFRNRFPERVSAFGFSKWKRPFVKDFFNGSDVRFQNRPKTIDRSQTVAVWGRKHDALLQSTGGLPKNLIRIEDGFLRSVGLGADLIRPISWVQDDLGIYYDATAPSRLEKILSEHNFDAELLARARALTERVLAANLTKYNLPDTQSWRRPEGCGEVILVPGQVESDASIKFGGTRIKRNIDLLRSVRERHPEAFIIYKPHPDVWAKLREQGEGESNSAAFCNIVLTDVSMHALLKEVDAVHTITSLTGFEALLRGVRVVTYGQPFYAGWGLTEDLAITEDVKARRHRTVSLQALVAATLILYPTYVSRVTGRFTTPERAVDELVTWRKEAPKVPRWRRLIAQLFRKI